jgi:N-acetylglucosamine-6-phosphate deacetylase
VTVAPEISRMIEDVIPILVNKYDLIVSIGHSIASLAEGERAFCAGARFITHLFNAMLPFHHRDPGLVGKYTQSCVFSFIYNNSMYLGLLTSHRLPVSTVIHYGIIVDGIHTHSAAVRLAHRVHPQGLVLVTDAVPALGLPDGTYHMGADQIIVEKKRATIAGTQTLCGSIASMAECVQNMRQALLDGEINKPFETNDNKNQTKNFIVESIEAATLHPASGILFMLKSLILSRNETMLDMTCSLL